VSAAAQAAIPAGVVAGVPAGVAEAVAADVRAIVERSPADPLEACVVPAAVARELMGRHGLASQEQLALLALPVARTLARAPLSGYLVAAVGIEAEASDLVLGANLEFPGTDLGTTVHAEGFVPLRARRRGHTLAVLAVASARPCAHCRQTLAESAGADRLVLIDLDGNRRSLDELYPVAFRPAALGVEADSPGAVRWPGLAIDPDAAPDDVARALAEAGAVAHAPYSEAPSAVALRLDDGRILSAGCVESVAFNPTITAAQAAMVELAAARAEGQNVTGAWLARLWGARVDPEPAFRALLGAVAPHAGLRVVDWRRAPG
jgi:cytidine deaminase